MDAGIQYVVYGILGTTDDEYKFEIRPKRCYCFYVKVQNSSFVFCPLIFYRASLILTFDCR